MKRLKTIKYTVEIWNCSNGFFWRALGPSGTEKQIHTETQKCRDGGELVFSSLRQKPGRGFETERECKKDWERFAMLNGLKKWKWSKE